MKLHGLVKNARGTASFGCIWNKGEIPAEAAKRNGFVCINERGEKVTLQSRITAYWPDGSVKWTAHSADSKDLGDSFEVTGIFSDPMQQHEKECLNETKEGYVIFGKDFEVVVSKSTGRIFESVKKGKDIIGKNAEAVLMLEEPGIINGYESRTTKRYEGVVKKIILEEAGYVQTVLRYEGIHVCKQGTCKGEEKIPFIIRMFVGSSTGEIRFKHTFLYDGDENRDYLKGIGIEFESPVSGALFNRHVKFTGDFGAFHEASMALTSWRPMKWIKEAGMDSLITATSCTPMTG